MCVCVCVCVRAGKVKHCNMTPEYLSVFKDDYWSKEYEQVSLRGWGRPSHLLLPVDGLHPHPHLHPTPALTFGR